MFKILACTNVFKVEKLSFDIMIRGSKQAEDMKSRKDGTIPPFHPDLNSEKHVRCKHCGETYKEKEIKWDAKSGRWVCKHHPNCDGSGWLPF
ncbi:MAG: hypothetical protein O8C64_03760 [Candidatus Methanoperedens sp.]|nr:hypothetical protein [Candidatus Methanoperedens sp.]